MSDMNLSKQNIFCNPADYGYKINSKIVLRSIGHVFEPVFEFLGPEKKEEVIQDYSKAIEKQEMQNANYQRIIGVKKSKFNIVI